jgi:L-idonate 5-dehydrogenase
MSGAVLSATLFGAEDLRVVETAPAPLPPGMVRVEFGAGGICGSDMHYFRHGRTGDFIVKSPLILGHEIAGLIAEVSDGGSGLKPGGTPHPLASGFSEV